MSSGKENRLLSLPEGKLLIFGTLLLALYLLFLFFSWLLFPESYQTLAAMSAGNLFFGRAAGISVGFAAEMSSTVVIGINFLVELLLVLIIYPLFVLSWNQFLNIGRLKSLVDKSHASAVKYHPVIEKYGVYGLFAFVWFPFWMTGPVVGSIIGYMMEFRHRTTLSVVLIGTLIATTCWAYFILFLQEWAAAFDERAPWFIAAGIVLLVIIGYIMRKLSK